MMTGPAISGDLGVNEIIRILGMTPHPEGGHYVETYRAPAEQNERSAATAIYYLLAADEVSAWHRIDASETWHWYAGGALALTLSPPEGQGVTAYQLGPNLRAGQRPQVTIPPHHWQAAETLGAWTLCGCTVAPGFDFSGFEMAPPDWRPTV